MWLWLKEGQRPIVGLLVGVLYRDPAVRRAHVLSETCPSEMGTLDIFSFFLYLLKRRAGSRTTHLSITVCCSTCPACLLRPGCIKYIGLGGSNEVHVLILFCLMQLFDFPTMCSNHRKVEDGPSR